MRKLVFILALLIIPASLFAQDEGWRDRGSRGRDRDRYEHRYGDNSFELTPFVGYTWGGTLSSGQSIFAEDADVASSANVGASFSFPVAPNGMKIELMVDHQSTNLTTGSASLFDRGINIGDLDVTYYQAGLLVPLGDSRSGVLPFFVASGGLATLDPRGNGTAATRFAATVGGGVKVPINRTVGLRAEARAMYTSLPSDETCNICNFGGNRDLWQGQANFGVYFKF
jgi:hypothetical protein